MLWVYLLVLFFSSQLGLHFWPSWAYSFGLRHDYLSPTLYTTDILLLINFVTHLPLVRKAFHRYFTPFLITLILISLNTFFSSLPFLTALNWFRYLLYFFFLYKLTRLTLPSINFLLKLLYLSTLLISLLALTQFFLGHSLNGLFYFLGERSLSLYVPGIAKSYFLGAYHLRPYATFSHPNSLAGFLLLTLLLFSYRPKFSHFFQFVFTSLLTFTLLLTTSKSAILGLSLLSLLHLFPSFLKTKKFLLIIYSSSFILSLSPLLNLTNTPSWFSDRHLLLVSGLRLLLRHPILGYGLGAYTKAQVSLTPTLFLPNHLSLALQPIHNSFLLLLIELGLLLVVSFFFLITYALKRFKHSLSPLFYFIPLLPTLLFDHYWFTLPQNRLLLVFFLGLIFNSRWYTQRVNS